MGTVKLHADFKPPAFLRAIRVTPCEPHPENTAIKRREPAVKRPIGSRPVVHKRDDNLPIADRYLLHGQILPAVRGAKSMTVLSSFLFSREYLVDAIEEAWKKEQVRSYWMTSDTRIRQSYAQGDDSTRSAQDRELLTEFSNLLDSAVLRFGSYHAKYVLIDPLTTDRRGWITSCNLIDQAFAENLEVYIELTQDECKDLYRLARHLFWQNASTELCEDSQQRAATSPLLAPLPEPDGDLIWTVDKKSNRIREQALRLINDSNQTIDICGHSWSPDHPVLEALAAKARSGVKVRLLGWRFMTGDRQPPIHRTLHKLIEAGVEVLEVPKLHAKYLLTEKSGLMCTANFARKGLDEGIEVGLLLNKTRLEDARKAFEHFASMAQLRSFVVPALSPKESTEADLATYRPEMPDTPLQTKGTYTLGPKVVVASCASTVKEEAQEALRSLLKDLAEPKNKLAAWTSQEGGNPKAPRILNETITAVVECRPPTVPSKLRMPDSDPTNPQVIEHNKRRWVVIPDPGKDHVLMAQAVALAKSEGCNVAFWAFLA